MNECPTLAKHYVYINNITSSLERASDAAAAAIAAWRAALGLLHALYTQHFFPGVVRFSFAQLYNIHLWRHIKMLKS